MRGGVARRGAWPRYSACPRCPERVPHVECVVAQSSRSRLEHGRGMEDCRSGGHNNLEHGQKRTSGHERITS